MSDGKVRFDTKISLDGFKEGCSKIIAFATRTFHKVKSIGGGSFKELRKEASQNLDVIGKGFEKTGAKMSKFITKPALVAAGALAGITLKKGFDRLESIDTAKAKLEGLGHSAESIDGIMDSALTSVRGTMYGLGDAATTAASAVASGIKPGKDLTRYLSLVADTASIAGTDMGEMGAVFNKVAANGKMSAEELNMLTDRGVPALQLLADATGKTVEEVRKDMEEGKIDVETFLTAMEKGFGGAAQIMGAKSFTAAAANIGASLGRIGANFLDAGGKGGGFFSQMKPLMAELLGWLGKVEEKSVEWGESFGAAFAKGVEWFKAAPKPLLATAAALTVGAGPALKLAGAFLKAQAAAKKFRSANEGTRLAVGVLRGELTASQAIIGALPGKIKSVTSAIGSMGKGYSLLTGKLARLDPALRTTSTLYGSNASALYAQTSGIKAAAQGVSFYVGSMARKAASTTRATISTIRDTTATIANTAATKWNGSVAQGAAKKILAFASAHRIALMASLGLVGAIAALAIYMNKTGSSAEDVANMITTFADKAAMMITRFANELPGMIDSIMPAITKTVQALVTVIPALILALVQALVDNLPALIDAGVTLFMGLTTALTQIVEPLVMALVQLVTAVIEIIPTLIPQLIQAGITLFMSLIQALPQVIDALVDAMPQIVQAFANAVPVLIPALIQAAVTLFMAIVQAIPKIIVALINAIPQIITAIVTGLIAGISQVFSVGVQLLQMLWRGISSWAGSLKSKVVSLAKSLPGKIKSGLGSLVGIGRDFIAGLWTGIKAKFDSVISSVQGLISKLPKAVKKVLGIASPSKVMAAIGKWIPVGLVKGIESKTRALLGAARAQMSKLQSVYDDGVGDGFGIGPNYPHPQPRVVDVPKTMPVTAAAPNQTIVNQEVNINQPVSSPIETARALKKQAMFGLAGV